MCKWYSFDFRIAWPEEQPKTWVDLFIIDKIIWNIIISENKSKFELWRIHRRWADKIHELTFDCYTDKKTASWIEEFINKNEFYGVLQKNLIITKLKIREGGTNIQDIADDQSTRNWPKELKKVWPYYINGCCEMFLKLIDDLKKDFTSNINETSNKSEIEKSYTELENELTKIWQYHGNNAFFHHINAIFGYSSLYIQPQLWARF